MCVGSLPAGGSGPSPGKKGGPLGTACTLKGEEFRHEYPSGLPNAEYLVSNDLAARPKTLRPEIEGDKIESGMDIFLKRETTPREEPAEDQMIRILSMT